MHYANINRNLVFFCLDRSPFVSSETAMFFFLSGWLPVRDLTQYSPQVFIRVDGGDIPEAWSYSAWSSILFRSLFCKWKRKLNHHCKNRASAWCYRHHALQHVQSSYFVYNKALSLPKISLNWYVNICFLKGCSIFFLLRAVCDYKAGLSLRIIQSTDRLISL